MTHRIFPLILLAAFGLAACSQSDETAETEAAQVEPEPQAVSVRDSAIEWRPFEAIQATFPAAPRPIFLYLYQEGCDHCALMDSTVFSRPEIIRHLNDRFTPVKVDPYADPPPRVQNSALSGEAFRQVLGIQETPAYYFFDPTGNLAGLFFSEMDHMLFKRMMLYIEDGHFGHTPFPDYLKSPEATDEAINARF